MILYKFLDYFFLVFHTVLTVFNLTGWIWRKTRRLNMVTLGLTFLAWFGLGIFYGTGYCPLTDWHFQVLQKLGVENLPNSYITYFIHRIFGLYPSERLVDIFTVTLFFAALAASIYVNLKGIKKTSGSIRK